MRHASAPTRPGIRISCGTSLLSWRTRPHACRSISRTWISLCRKISPGISTGFTASLTFANSANSETVSPMRHFAALSMIGRRLAGAVPSVIGVVIVTFVLTRALPGDPAAFFAGPAASAQAIQEVRAKLGLDRSLLGQFGVYMRDLVRGDLGTSLTTGQRVLQDLATRLPASLELTLCAIMLSVSVA